MGQERDQRDQSTQTRNCDRTFLAQPPTSEAWAAGRMERDKARVARENERSQRSHRSAHAGARHVHARRSIDLERRRMMERNSNRAAAALVCVLAMLLLSAATATAQSAQGISLPDVCSDTSLAPATVMPKRSVMGTSCTVYVDCLHLPLTAHACGAGQRFSFSDQQCVAAATTPCYEDQFPTPAGVATNRALKAAAEPVPSAPDGDGVRVMTWAPMAWQTPMSDEPEDGFSAADLSPKYRTKDAPKNANNYFRTCSTEAFHPERHRPRGTGAPAVPPSVQFVTRCSVCYPAVVCPNSRSFSPTMKGDFLISITTDYYACGAGKMFDGQACVASDESSAAAAAAAATATPPPAPAAEVTGSVTRGIDCGSMRNALAVAHTSPNATFSLVDSVCNSTVAPVAFRVINSTTDSRGQELISLRFQDSSELRAVQALMFNATTGVHGKSGSDQFTLGPTVVSTLAAHTSPEGTCTFVPLVNGTAKPPALASNATLQCPTPTNPSSLMTVADMPWGVVGVTVGGGVLGAMALGFAAMMWTASSATMVGIFGAAAGIAVIASTVGAVVVGVALIVAAAVLLILMLLGIVPPDLGLSSGCFPSTATVLGLLATSSMLSTMPMGQLALGDAVATASLAPGGGYGGAITTSPVYLFGHQAAGVLATFVELSTASGHAVQMTAGHFIHVWPAASKADTGSELANGAAGCHAAGAAAGARMTRAQDVSPERAEQLCVYDEASGTFALSPVVGKRVVHAQGLYAPFTMTGDLVVNGVLVSAHSDWLLDRIMPAKAVHHLPAVYQLLMWPARAAYALGGRRLMEFLDTQLRLVELASAVRL